MSVGRLPHYLKKLTKYDGAISFFYDPILLYLKSILVDSFDTESFLI